MWAMAIGSEHVIPVDVAGAWATAREKAGIKQEYLAHLMGIPHSQLCDQLANRGHLSLQRVARLKDDPDGRRFMRFFVVALAEQLGFDLDALFDITRIERLAQRLIGQYDSRQRRRSSRQVVS